MGKLQLKYIAGEFGTDLMDYEPDEKGFVLNVEIGIGIAGKNRADVFSFNVADAAGIQNCVLKNDAEYNSKGISDLSSYHLFAVKTYDYETILMYVNDIIKSIPEHYSHKQQGLLLSRYFEWENATETIDSIG